MSKATVGDFIVDRLQQWGIDRVFGYSGDGINGVSVQEMVLDGVEVILGLSYDSQLGATILFGTGGVMVEVYNDVALRLCPIDESDALEMIDEVKGARLLEGFRGRPAADIDALIETLVQVSNLGAQLEGSLAELVAAPLQLHCWPPSVHGTHAFLPASLLPPFSFPFPPACPRVW